METPIIPKFLTQILIPVAAFFLGYAYAQMRKGTQAFTLNEVQEIVNMLISIGNNNTTEKLKDAVIANQGAEVTLEPKKGEAVIAEYPTIAEVNAQELPPQPVIPQLEALDKNKPVEADEYIENNL